MAIINGVDMEVLRPEKYYNDDFPLCIRHTPDHPEFPMHRHGFCELVLVLAGSGVHLTLEDELYISAGDVFVVGEKVGHGYRDVDSLELVNIIFDFEKLGISHDYLRKISAFHALFHLEPKYRRDFSRNELLKVSLSKIGRLRELSLELQLEIENQKTGYQTMAISTFMELLIHVFRNIDQRENDHAPSYRFGQILSFMENHCSEKMTLDQLASLANMSRRNFQRNFKKIMTVSPIEYLLDIRMRKARDLLTNSSLNISQIGFACGFRDSNYFCRKFAEMMEVPPGNYRKKMAPD